MTDLKPVASPTDVDAEKAAISQSEAAAFENEVGYKEYLEGLSLQYSDSEDRVVRTKIDFVVLPIFLFTQLLQFLDKTCLVRMAFTNTYLASCSSAKRVTVISELRQPLRLPR